MLNSIWSKSVRVLFAIAIMTIWSSSAQAIAGDPRGVWITQEGKSLMNVAPCNGNANNGNKAVLCSKIIWLKKPFNDLGEPLRDRVNKNPKLRRRPILGMPILSDMRFQNGGLWQGKVYNPEDGKIYRAQMIPQGHHKLLVKGCAKIIFKWICRERIWKRASEQAIMASGMPLEPVIGK